MTSDAVPTTGFFTRHFGGIRNDYDGEVGFEFETKSAFKVYALGRGQAARGSSLQEAVQVTLWRVSDRAKLATVVVGPQSATDPNGYQYERMQPLALAAGTKYRLSQQTRHGMPDKWQDASITDAYTNDNLYAHHFQGCYSPRKNAFPAIPDGLNRRVGMLNFYVAKAESGRAPGYAGYIDIPNRASAKFWSGGYQQCKLACAGAAYFAYWWGANNGRDCMCARAALSWDTVVADNSKVSDEACTQSAWCVYPQEGVFLTKHAP